MSFFDNNHLSNLSNYCKMKKHITMLALLLGMFCYSEAQTFIEPNADGVDIHYSVTSDNLVQVAAHTYSGRVVVPDSVTHDSVTYIVNQVANRAFSNSSVTYIELPATLEKIGAMSLSCSTLDTLYMKCMNAPTNNYGVEIDVNYVKGLFNNNTSKVVIVPVGRLQYYRYSAWGVMTNLTAPGAVPVTMYAPKTSQLTVGNINLKAHNAASGYFTRNFEIGEKAWIAAYPDHPDTVFLGWDKGDVYLTEITQADTLRPIFDKIGHATLSVNNVSTPIKFTGLLSYMNRQSNYHVPAHSSTSPLYANGLWITGIDTNDWSDYVCATTYSCAGDYVPGPLTVDGQFRSDLETRRAFNRVWTVTRDEIDDFIANIGSPDYSIPENILSWPGNGTEGYAEQLAPYYDADSDGVYDPHHGDYPLIRGDIMAFSIFNDVTVAYYTGSLAMGFEIHMSAYAFDEPEDTSLNNTIFLSYKIHNRTNRVYVNSHIGVFTDFDLGYSYDDYMGCDVRYGMAYAYNGLTNDMDYEGVPPAQGCILLAGPDADPDSLDNNRIDIEKMHLNYPDELDQYQLSDGTYDMVRLNADADLYYPDGWLFNAGFDAGQIVDNTRHSSINGMNYGNGIVDDERLGMCKFIMYENNTNTVNGEPTSSNEYLSYLYGRWKNGSPMTYSGNAIGSSDLNSSFMFPNDSDPLHWGTGGYVPETNPNDWNEITAGNAPGDRRGLQATGPFTILPGEVNTIDMAFSTAFGATTNWSSVELLKEQASSIRRQFAHDTTDSGRPFTYMPYSAPIVDISQASQQPSVKIYPNPAHNSLTVSLGEGTSTNIDIYDIRGNRVLSVADASGLVNVDISALANGIYIIRCGSHVSRIAKM